MRTSLTVGVTAVLGVAAGVAGSHLLERHSTSARPQTTAEATEPAPEPRHDVVMVGPVTARLADEDRAALRALIREELAAGMTQSRGDDAGATTLAPRPPSQPLETTDSYVQARSVVDDGISHGSWSPADRTRLRDALSSLPTEARLEIVQPLVVAVNSGRVRFEGHGPLF
jgi:hypothetical protein